jgi:hypothetical protein
MDNEKRVPSFDLGHNQNRTRLSSCLYIVELHNTKYACITFLTFSVFFVFFTVDEMEPL